MSNDNLVCVINDSSCSTNPLSEVPQDTKSDDSHGTVDSGPSESKAEAIGNKLQEEEINTTSVEASPLAVESTDTGDSTISGMCNDTIHTCTSTVLQNEVVTTTGTPDVDITSTGETGSSCSRTTINAQRGGKCPEKIDQSEVKEVSRLSVFDRMYSAKTISSKAKQRELASSHARKNAARKPEYGGKARERRPQSAPANYSQVNAFCTLNTAAPCQHPLHAWNPKIMARRKQNAGNEAVPLSSSSNSSSRSTSFEGCNQKLDLPEKKPISLHQSVRSKARPKQPTKVGMKNQSQNSRRNLTRLAELKSAATCGVVDDHQINGSAGGVVHVGAALPGTHVGLASMAAGENCDFALAPTVKDGSLKTPASDMPRNDDSKCVGITGEGQRISEASASSDIESTTSENTKMDPHRVDKKDNLEVFKPSAGKSSEQNNIDIHSIDDVSSHASNSMNIGEVKGIQQEGDRPDKEQSGLKAPQRPSKHVKVSRKKHSRRPSSEMYTVYEETLHPDQKEAIEKEFSRAGCLFEDQGGTHPSNVS